MLAQTDCSCATRFRHGMVGGGILDQRQILSRFARNSQCARLWLTPALIFNIPATRQPQPLTVLLKLVWNKSTQYPNIHTNHITLTLLFTWQKPYCVILKISAKDIMKYIQIYLMFYIIHLMLILRATTLPYRSDY